MTAGSKIASIRQTSGAQIKIGEARAVGLNSIRDITISGIMEAVQFAIYLISEGRVSVTTHHVPLTTTLQSLTIHTRPELVAMKWADRQQV